MEICRGINLKDLVKLIWQLGLMSVYRGHYKRANNLLSLAENFNKNYMSALKPVIKRCAIMSRILVNESLQQKSDKRKMMHHRDEIDEFKPDKKFFDMNTIDNEIKSGN
jgi:hypothetical protein